VHRFTVAAGTPSDLAADFCGIRWNAEIIDIDFSEANATANDLFAPVYV